MLEPSVKLVDKLSGDIIGFKYQYTVVDDVPYYVALSCQMAQKLGADAEIHKFYDIPEIQVISFGNKYAEVSNVLFATDDFSRAFIDMSDKVIMYGYAFDKNVVLELDNEVILHRVKQTEE